MKRKLYSTLLLSMTSLVLSLYGCSGSEKSDTITYDVTADVSVPEKKTPSEAAKKTLDKPQLPTENADIDTSSEPYILGREHAVRLHSDISDTELCDELLDINARITNIRNRIGNEAAENYIAGLRDYLKENSDTLYMALF